MTPQDPAQGACPRCHAVALGPEHVSVAPDGDRIDLVVRDCSSCGPVLVRSVTAFDAVHQALGRVPAEISTAGELAALMAALPPHTPVSVADTVRVDPDLDLDVTAHCTAAAVSVVTLLEPYDDDSRAETSPDRRALPGVELGAFIVAAGGQIPERTAAIRPYEAAVEALQDGDVARALEADCELLRWMAGTLADPLPVDSYAAPAWIADVDLREELAVEAERLRQCAARLTTLRAKVLAVGQQRRAVSPPLTCAERRCAG